MGHPGVGLVVGAGWLQAQGYVLQNNGLIWLNEPPNGMSGGLRKLVRALVQVRPCVTPETQGGSGSNVSLLFIGRGSCNCLRRAAPPPAEHFVGPLGAVGWTQREAGGDFLNTLLPLTAGLGCKATGLGVGVL